MKTASQLGPTDKRTEERAPVWGSECGGSKEFVPGLYVVVFGPVVARARVLVHKVLDRGAQAVACGGAR